MSSAGKITISVAKQGYPVWCDLYYNDERIANLHHCELSDLAYAARKAMREAEIALGDKDKHEVSTA